MGNSRGDFLKFPRTPHIFGSKGTTDDKRLSDEDSLKIILDNDLVVEEKIDGSNTGIHFNSDKKLILQSRGHEIQSKEHPHFDLLKNWAQVKQIELFDLLGYRYIMYGEWMYAKHQVYYNSLPHYFIEFDIWDKENSFFLNTEKRRQILVGSSIESVPVLKKGKLNGENEIEGLIQKSVYGDETAEGLYFKVEKNGTVITRAKYVRQSFTQSVEEVGKHWKKLKLTPNELLTGVNIFV